MSESQQPSVPPQPSGTHDLTPTGHVAPAAQAPAPAPAGSAPPPATGHPNAATAHATANAYAGYAPAPMPPAQGNPLGRAALLVAIIAFAVDLVAMLATPFLYISGSGTMMMVGILSTFVNIVVLITAIAALVMGVIALRRPAPHILAGIAIGIAATEVLSSVFAWVSNLFYAFL